MRRLFFPLLALLLGLTATAVAGELLVRLWSPPPRVQVFRGAHAAGSAEARDMQVVDGVPVWSFAAAAPRYDLDCRERHPHAPRVLVLGSSIFAGVSVDPHDVFTKHLASRLTPGEPVCVFNLAEPAYSFQNQAKVAERYLDELDPDLVIWEMWGNSPWPYKVLHGTAYRFRDLIVGEDGTPNPLRTWPPLHRWLLPHSRLYELTVLTLAVQMHPQWGRLEVSAFADGPLTHTLETLKREVPILTVFCPKLSSPFAAQRDQRHHADPKQRDERYETMERAISALKIPIIHLDELLADANIRPEDVRLDPCCHFNVEGQEVVADVLLPYVRQQLTDSMADEVP